MSGHSLRPIGRCFVLVVSLSVLLSGPLLSQAKKLRVTAETASVYLKPDEGSSVIATVKQGTLLTLQNARKYKRTWYHVLFLPERSKITKSGYIHDSTVERLFVVTKIETLEDGTGMKKDFRQAKWQMTQDQVLRLEGNPVFKEKSNGLDVLRYKDTVKEMDSWIEYIFKEDRLIKAKYIFFEDHDYKNQYFGDYRKVKEFLTEVHGQSPLTNVNWMNPTHKDDYSKWGLAVSLGHLEYSAIWNLPESEIVLRLFGKNNEIILIVDYTGIIQKDKE